MRLPAFTGDYRMFLILAAVIGSMRLPAKGQTTLEDELGRVVKIVKENLGQSPTLRVDPFRDLSSGTRLSGAIRTGLTAAFEEECGRQEITIRRDAEHIFEGRFVVTDEESLRAGRPLVFELQWGLINRRGSQVVEIIPSRVQVGAETAKHFARIAEPRFLAQAIGLVGMVSVEMEYGQFDQQSVAAMALEPTGTVRDKRIRSHATSNYEVEIVTRPAGSAGKYEPRKATVDDGLPVVDIPQDHEYQIRIFNHSDEPVAVAASIDGLSVFHFADPEYRDPVTGKLSNTHYLIRANDIGVIPGWYFRRDEANNVGRFLVTSYGDSAAGQLGIPEGEDSGAIHLQFCQCASGLRTRGVGDANRSLGTAIGERDTIKFAVSECTPGEPFEFLTVRYSRIPHRD